MKTKKVIGLMTILILNISSALTQPTFEWAISGGSVNMDGGVKIDFDDFGFNYDLVNHYGASSTVYLSLTKRDENGVLQWTRNLNNGMTVRGQALAVDVSGNVYIAGSFEGTADFNPNAGVNNLTSNGSDDNFIVKLDSDGNFLWAKSFGGTEDERISDIDVDNNGNIFLIGSYNSTVDFDPGVGTFNNTSNGTYDAFIQKLNSNGDFLWVKTIGGTYTDFGSSITIDQNGDIVSSGTFIGTVDLDPGLGESFFTSIQGADIFLLKLDTDGNHIWSKWIGGPGNSTNRAADIKSTPSNDIYLTGSFYNTVDFDPNGGVHEMTASSPSGDCFVLKLNALGQFIWGHNFGSTGGYGSGNSIAFDGNENVYIMGVFKGTVDFDPSPSSAFELTVTEQDHFLLKLDNNGNFDWVFNSTPVSSIGSSASSVAVDDNFNIIVSGAFYGTRDFDFGVDSYEMTSNGSYDHFTLFLSPECMSTSVTPDQVSLSNLVSQCSIANLTPPTATNSCGESVEAVYDVTLPITTQGTTVVTWAYDDGNGNTSTQTQNVVIDDVTAPIADVVSLTNVTSECSVTSLTAPTATDNCSGSVTGTHNVTLPITSSITITWTYDDGNGNTSTQTQEVIIDDVTAPVPNVTSLSPVTAQCQINSITPPTATDNCSGSITGTHNATLPITTSTTITWTYDDGNGNTSTQTQEVIIDDLTAPIADEGTLANVTSECEVTSLATPTATDNCIGSVTGTHSVTLPITAIGTTPVTWTYDDGNGNTSTQIQNVVITPINNGVTQDDDVTLNADAAGYNYQWVDCNNGNQAIIGETNQTFVATANGSYAVEIDNGLCTVTSNCITINTVGIESLDQKKWKVYPNPANEKLIVELEENTNIQILDVFGKIVQTETLKTEKNSIDVSTLTSGVYFIQALSGATIKFVKN